MTSTTTDPPVTGLPTPAVSRSSRRWIFLAVSLATFMTALDNNIINVAVPTIQRDLHLTGPGIEWIVSAYILAFAGLLLAGGRLADVIGRRRVFLVGLGVFTAASALAGAAHGLDLLVASRALQGVGAALVTPTTLAVVSSVYPEPREQAAAVGAWSAVGALALAVGPLLGGVLSQYATWHWIFFINVPVGAATLALGAAVIPATPGAAGRSLDVPGVATSSVALLALTWALIEGTRLGWSSPGILGAFGLAGLAGWAFVRGEGRAADPMFDLSLLRNRIFTGGVTALMLWAFGLFGIYFFTSLYLQNVLAFSATVAGAAFVPMAVLMAAGAVVSDRVADRIGVHRSVGAAMALMAAGMAAVSLLGAHASLADLMPGFALIGIGGGLTIPLTSAILTAMPPERAGVATAVFNTTREVAGLLGITVIGVVLSARRAAVVHAGRSPLTAFLAGYRLGLVVAAGLVATGGLVAWRSLRLAASTAAPPAGPTGPARDRTGVPA